MRALIRPGLAHKTVSALPESRVIPGDLGYAQGLCVPHANLSELAVPRINAGRIQASREEVNVINLRQPDHGRTMKNLHGCTAIVSSAQEENGEPCVCLPTSPTTTTAPGGSR